MGKSHAATMTELHTKTRSIKELMLQSEEDRKNIIILQESLDKLNEKIKMYKRQLEEQESISNSNIMRVKKFQRELESAENRAEEAESTLNQFRSRERVFASASARSEKSTDVQETEVVVKKTINKVNIGSSSVGGEDQEGGAGEEGGRGAGQEEADGGGRKEKARDARRSEGGRQEVFRSCHGCPQGDVQVQGAGGGGDEDLSVHPYQAPGPR